MFFAIKTRKTSDIKKKKKLRKIAFLQIFLSGKLNCLLNFSKQVFGNLIPNLIMQVFKLKKKFIKNGGIKKLAKKFWQTWELLWKKKSWKIYHATFRYFKFSIQKKLLF